MRNVDEDGLVTARATVVPFRPPTYPLAFDVAERDGGGRFVVAPDDLAKVEIYAGYTVRFHPQDQFARVVVDEPKLAPLPWERESAAVAEFLAAPPLSNDEIAAAICGVNVQWTSPPCEMVARKSCRKRGKGGRS